MTEVQKIAAEIREDAQDTGTAPGLSTALQDYADRLDRLDAGDAGAIALRNVLEVMHLVAGFGQSSEGTACVMLSLLKNRGYILVREP